MVRPEKATAVQEITARFQESDAALLTEYRGLTVGEIADLRNALREANTDYKVLKNTLARIAVREVGYDDLAEMLTGPTAVAFVKGDAVEAAKALDDAAKKFPVLVIKGGVMSGKIITAEQASALAKLEPRETQLAKIAMLANSPLQSTVNVFAAMLRDLGSMLAQVVSKKESGELPGGSGEAPAEAQAEAAPTEEAPAAEASEAEAPSAEAAEAEAPAAEATEPEAPEADRGEAAAEASDVAAETASDTTEEVAESVEADPSTGDEAASSGEKEEG